MTEVWVSHRAKKNLFKAVYDEYVANSLLSKAIMSTSCVLACKGPTEMKERIVMVEIFFTILERSYDNAMNRIGFTILERSYDDVEEKGGAGWYDVTSAPVTVSQAGRYHCATQKTIHSLQSPN